MMVIVAVLWALLVTIPCSFGVSPADPASRVDSVNVEPRTIKSGQLASSKYESAPFKGGARSILWHPPPSGKLAGRRARRDIARCFGIRGDWCLAFYHQQPVEWDDLPLHDKPCPNNCSNVGVCHADTGLCDCPAGMQKSVEM